MDKETAQGKGGEMSLSILPASPVGFSLQRKKNMEYVGPGFRVLHDVPAPLQSPILLLLCCCPMSYFAEMYHRDL